MSWRGRETSNFSSLSDWGFSLTGCCALRNSRVAASKSKIPNRNCRLSVKPPPYLLRGPQQNRSLSSAPASESRSPRSARPFLARVCALTRNLMEKPPGDHCHVCCRSLDCRSIADVLFSNHLLDQPNGAIQMGNRLAFSCAVLASAGVVAMLADGSIVGASGAVPVQSAHRIPSGTRVDPVLEWNQILNDTVLASVPAPNSLVTSRSAALVAAAVFDAVNGIDSSYKPLYIASRASSGTSARAAAIQASYAMLIRLYPAQSGPLTMRRNASIAVLGSAQAVQRGMLWGQAVSDSLWVARQSDGFTPAMAPFMGSATLGFWRPTPPGNLSGSGPQFATMTPWVLTRPSQFRPAPPPALASADYAADYNETRLWGGATGSLRQPDDADVARFWSGNGTLYWNRIATQLAAARHRTLVENAHLFAVLHIAMADSSIATWDAKYR